MKRQPLRRQQLQRFPTAQRSADDAARSATAESTFDARFNEDIFDAEDVRMEVGIIVSKLNRATH
jgi:hypothetical protein